MCGIAGVAGRGRRADAESDARRMTHALVHRGPDDEGYWSDERIALGMRRLSIIDLPGGHQPMTGQGGVTLVFNGEIYNYRALRDELIARGRQFRTTSDTEVVLALYEAEGIDAIQRLEGMFAMCIWDPRAGIAHLVRDRLGKKPLYYAPGPERLLFASEIKAILAALPARPALDRQALHHYLTLRYVPAPATPWEGIRKLEPGHRLEVDVRSGATTLHRYWSVDFVSAPDDSDRPYLEEFERLFGDAVEKRLVAADVPVGVMLSGGLDSSAVSAIAVERGHRAFHTFSVGYKDGGRHSELRYAREMAAHVGSRHHEVEIGRDDFVEFLPQFVWDADEPLADLASIPLYFVSRLAREHVKVVLSGEGTDEVLAGYDMEALAARLDRLHGLGRVLPARVLRAAGRRVPRGRGAQLRALGEEGWSGYLKHTGAHMTHVWSEVEKARLWREHDGFAPTGALIRSWYDECPSGHPLDQLQQVYCRSWLVDDLLMKADKMTMAASLELRTPFLDHALVEWCAALPLAWKVGDRRSGYVSKRILREFARPRLPETMITRPKQGFPVPANDWLRGELGPWADRRLLREPGVLGELFDVGRIAPALERARAGDPAAADRTWAMLVLQLWLERWT